MNDKIDEAWARGRQMVLAIVTLLIGGCLTDSRSVELRLNASQPAALEAAKDRARSDLSCDQITADVVSRSPMDTGLYAIDRAEYKILTRGCGKQIVLTVACARERVCSALAQDAMIEPIKK